MQPMIAPRRITDDKRNHTEPNKGVRFLLWFRFHTVFLTLLLFVPTQAQTQGQTQAQAQAQAQAQTEDSAPPESAEPVPTLTRESFESLPPGRYFLQINPKLCHQVEHCFGFNPTWDALASQLKDNAHYAGNMFRIECADDPDFCDKLLGSYFMERRSANIFITLVAVETDADANTDTDNIVRMEYFLRDMVPEELIAWLAGFVNKRLMPMSLPPGMAAASLSSSNANTNNPPSSSSSSSIAMLMLSMDGLGVRSDVWCRFLTLAVEQGIDAKLYVHDMLVAGHPPGHLYCPRPEHALANAAILAIPAPFLQFTSWATISLVKTVVVMLRASMLFGGADWYAIVSDNSVPLVDPRTMVARLSGPGFVAPDGSTASVFQNMDPGRPHPKEVEDRRLFIRPPYRLPPSSSSSSSSEEPRSQSQLQSPRPLELSPSDFTVAEFWSILDRRAGAWFAEHEHFSDFEMTFAPDDTYFVSLAKVYGLPLRMASAHRYPSPEEEEEEGGGGGGGVPPKVETEAHGMYTAWSTNLHHPHPEVLSEISPETIQEWSQGDRHSFLFARKISDTTTIDLPWLGQDYDGTHDEL